MSIAIKSLLIAIYVAAIIGPLAGLSQEFTSAVQYTAVILLALHLLELLFVFRSVKRYNGPLIDSVALTLLFGFLHWKPLSR
jgi:hypothetical protein